MLFNMFQSDPDLSVSPQEAKEKMDKGEKIVLLDVREPREIAINRLGDPVHIPLADLPNRYRELSPDAEIIVYCHMGVRSMKATRFLKDQQFKNVKNLTGGIEAWSVNVDSSVPRYR